MSFDGLCRSRTPLILSVNIFRILVSLGLVAVLGFVIVIVFDVRLLDGFFPLGFMFVTSFLLSSSGFL